MEIGASFSHRHLKNMGLDPLKAIVEFKKLNLKWIRVGIYWDEVEKIKAKFDFSNTDSLLTFCEKNSLQVVLTIGMKAPRWPEYYLPSWVKPKIPRFGKIKDSQEVAKNVKLFIEKTINHYKNHQSIKIWQIENEPLDNSGEKWWKIDFDLLASEVQLVKKLDKNRKTLINLWGNELTKRKVYKKAVQIADIVGFDLYAKHPIPYLKWFNRYIGPMDSDKKIQNVVNEINDQEKEFWITELQAEPWEPNELTTKSENPPSFMPNQFEKNLKWGKNFNPKVILLWGFEYWYWRKTLGDLRYWNKAKGSTAKYQTK